MKLNYSAIYLIMSVSKPNLFYIGSAKNISLRWDRHVRELQQNKHHCHRLQRHVKKYGIGDLHFEVLQKCDYDGILDLEQRYLDLLNPTLNACKLVGKPHSVMYKGKKMPVAYVKKMLKTKEKKGNTRQYYVMSEETRRKASESHMGNPGHWTGKKFSDEHKKHLAEARAKNPRSAWNKGIKWTDEQKEEMRQIQLALMTDGWVSPNKGHHRPWSKLRWERYYARKKKKENVDNIKETENV